MKKRVGILISGRGSNMMALVEAARAADYPAEIALVISNRPDAPGLQRAQSAGLKALAIDHKAFASREAFDDAIEAALTRGRRRPRLPRRLHAHPGRRLRRPLAGAPAQHPSLAAAVVQGPAPAQAGARRRACASSGCTVHFVTPELDAGPIVAQAAVPVLAGDTPDTLAERILIAEHRLYPFALRLVASGQARLEGGRVLLKATANQGDCLFSPRHRRLLDATSHRRVKTPRRTRNVDRPGRVLPVDDNQRAGISVAPTVDPGEGREESSRGRLCRCGRVRMDDV